MTNLKPQGKKHDVATVYYSAWEMDCCGKPFAVGDEIEMPVSKYDAENDVAESAQFTYKIQYIYDGHGLAEDDGETSYILRGKVKKIFIEYSMNINAKTTKTIYIESDYAHRFIPIMALNIENEIYAYAEQGKFLSGQAKKMLTESCALFSKSHIFREDLRTDKDSYDYWQKSFSPWMNDSGYSGFIVIIADPVLRDLPYEPE